MTDSYYKEEIIDPFRELNKLVASINSKLDNEVNEVNIDESSGDLNITRKINTLKDIPNEKSEKENDNIKLNKIKKDIEIADSYEECLSQDIEDGIECICSGMQKYYIDESLNVLGYELEQMQENKIEFNTKDFLIELEERIDDIFTNMISELKPRINKLHHKIKRKYIGEEKKSRKIFSYDYEHKKQLNLLKPFVEDKSVFHPAVVRWN